jgi:hypothetical protein
VQDVVYLLQSGVGGYEDRKCTYWGVRLSDYSRAATSIR